MRSLLSSSLSFTKLQGNESVWVGPLIVSWNIFFQIGSQILVLSVEITTIGTSLLIQHTETHNYCAKLLFDPQCETTILVCCLAARFLKSAQDASTGGAALTLQSGERIVTTAGEREVARSAHRIVNGSVLREALYLNACLKLGGMVVMTNKKNPLTLESAIR